MRSLNIAATGIQAQQAHVDVISHNLANMTTTGYKRQRIEFADLIYDNQRRMGTNSSDVGTIVPTGTQFGLGVKTAGIYRSHNQGVITQTENALDVAIQGQGFFQITLPNGDFAYTRDGSFQRNADGEIVTFNGYPVSPTVVIPDNATSVSINANGEVEATIDGQVTPVNLGQFDMVNFVNPAGLEALGENLYKETEASGAPIVDVAGADGFGTLTQGFLEQSNVNPVTEITDLIVAQRAYEMNTKVITASDEMLQSLNQSA